MSTELHQSRFLGLLQAITLESSVGNGKIPLLADCPGFGFFCGFFRRLGKLHQTRFLGVLQAIPTESGVGNGKIPVLGGCPRFPSLRNFWRFFGELEDDSVLRLPLYRIAPNLVSWAFAGHSTEI